MKNSIFMLAMVLLGGSILDAQVRESDNGKESVLDRFYFKAGAELFSYSSDNFSSRGGVNGLNLIGSFIYDYLDNIQMEFVYIHNIGRDHKSESMHFGTIDEYAYTSNYEEVLGNGIDLKVNYFLNRDKTENPVYITAALGFDVQNKEIRESYDYVNRITDTITGFSRVTSSYNRLLLGPSLGVGIFLAFGKVNIQSEVVFGARIAPFVDRGYKEFILSVGLSPVYKF